MIFHKSTSSSQQAPRALSRLFKNTKWNQSSQSALLSNFSPFHYKSCIFFIHENEKIRSFIKWKKKLITWWISELFFIKSFKVIQSWVFSFFSSPTLSCELQKKQWDDQRQSIRNKQVNDRSYMPSDHQLASMKFIAKHMRMCELSTSLFLITLKFLSTHHASLDPYISEHVYAYAIDYKNNIRQKNNCNLECWCFGNSLIRFQHFLFV